MTEVIPSLIATTKEEFLAGIQKLEPFTERVHLDVLDGAFTSGKTIQGYEELQTIETKLKFEIHLMVMHPEQYVPQWLNVPNADRIVISAESQGNLRDVFAQVRGQGKKVGLALNPETRIDSILEYIDMIDYIQFMTVHPGSYGRPFLPEVVDKILTFHDLHPDTPIAIDGGMNPDTAKRVIGLGATVIVSGSYILNSPDIPKAIQELKGNQ